MKYEFKLIIVSAVLCLLLLQVAPAGVVIKTLYVDGNVIGSSGTSHGLSWPFGYLTIGCEGSEFYRYQGFNGQIDEFAVYDKALSSARITVHYAAKDANNTYTAAVKTDDPNLWLRFEDASSSNGATAANSGGSPSFLAGKYVGGSKYGPVALTSSPFGHAADFNNSPSGGGDGNGTCVSVNDSNGVLSFWLPTGDVTVEFWVRFDMNDPCIGSPRFFQHNNDYANAGGYGAMYNMTANDSDPNSSIGVMGGGTTAYLRQPIRDGNWHHIVIVYQAVTLADGSTYSKEVLADNPIVYEQFDGDVATEAVKHQYRYYWRDTLGTTLYYDFNYPPVAFYESSARTIKDGGIGNSAYLDNTRRYYSGAPGVGSKGIVSIATIYGTDNGGGTLSYADVGFKPKPAAGVDANKSGYDVNYAFTPGDVTYEIWVRRPLPGQPRDPMPWRRLGDDGEPCTADPNNYNYYSTIFQQMRVEVDPNIDHNYPANSWPLHAGPALSLMEGNVVNGDPCGNIRIACGAQWWYPWKFLPNDGEWHQLVVCYDVNDVCGVTYRNGKPIGDTNVMKVKLYMDGALAASADVNDPCNLGRARLGPWLNHMVIGAGNDRGLGINGFSGSVDEFAIYPYILSAQRIATHYLAWQPKNCDEILARGGIPGDLNQDCKVDFFDFAEFALSWASCNDPAGAGCTSYR